MNIEIIRERIKSRGLKGSWIADQLKISRGTLSRFLTGKTILSGDKLLELLNLLGLNLSDVKKVS